MLLASSGGRIPASTLHLRLDRTVGHRVHEDYYEIVNYGPVAVEVDLEISVECDFADACPCAPGTPVGSEQDIGCRDGYRSCPGLFFTGALVVPGRPGGWRASSWASWSWSSARLTSWRSRSAASSDRV